MTAPTTTAAAPLAALPDDARVWLYATAAPLSEADARTLAGGLAEFFGAWRSHGRVVHGAAEVIENRLVVVAATLDRGDISGCGIDQHVRVLDRLLAETGSALASALDVVYRDRDGRIGVATRAEAKRLRASGEIAAVVRRDAPTLGDVRRALAGASGGDAT